MKQHPNNEYSLRPFNHLEYFSGNPNKANNQSSYYHNQTNGFSHNADQSYNESFYYKECLNFQKPAEIEFFCMDHKNLKSEKEKSIYGAERYCTKCSKLICDICVVEFHHDHMEEARTNAKSYFMSKKTEVEKMKNKNTSIIQRKDFLEEIEKKEDSMRSLIKKIIRSKINQAETVMKKLESLCNKYSEVETKLIANLDSFFKDDLYQKLDRPIEKLNRGNYYLISFSEQEFDRFP